MSIGYNDLEDKVSNIIEAKQFNELTLIAMEQISQTIGLTLGPYGHEIMIEDPTTGHYSTKDGFSVMTKLNFPGNVTGLIMNWIKDVSRELVKTVGDGSTSSVLIANELFRVLMKQLENTKIRPKEVFDILKDISEEVAVIIKEELAQPLSEDLSELKDIATVSVNNDAKLGELIANAYKELGTADGFINVKLNVGSNTRFECVKGFQIDRGYMDKILINEPDTKECILNETDILMFDAGLYDPKFVKILNNLSVLYYGNNRNLVVVLPGAGQNVRQWMAGFCRDVRSKSLPIRVNFIELPNAVEEDARAYEDLAIKVGARIIQTIDKEEDTIDWTLFPENELNPITKYLGSAESAISSEDKTTFVDGRGNAEMIATRIAAVEQEVKAADKGEDVIMSSKHYKLKKRLAVLNDKLATVYVGGSTDQEKISNKALVDDSVSACKSAITHGYIKGCNLGLRYAITKLYAKELELGNVNRLIVLRSLVDTVDVAHKIVLNNAKDMIDYSVLADHIECSDLARSVIRDRIYSGCISEVIEDIVVSDIVGNELAEKGPTAMDIANAIYEMNINIVEGSKINIVNSADTDIQILKAVASIIGLLINCRGMISTKNNSVYYK